MIEHHVSVRVRIIIGGLWFATLNVMVLTAYLTRSSFADVKGLGGVFIVGSCVLVIAVTCGLLRSAFVLGLTACAAGFLGSMVAWNVLHDESSTAALGVIAPAIVSGLVAFVGIALDVLVSAKRTHSPEEAPTP
jgi:hypothetical protein